MMSAAVAGTAVRPTSPHTTLRDVTLAAPTIEEAGVQCLLGGSDLLRLSMPESSKTVEQACGAEPRQSPTLRLRMAEAADRLASLRSQRAPLTVR